MIKKFKIYLKKHGKFFQKIKTLLIGILFGLLIGLILYVFIRLSRPEDSSFEEGILKVVSNVFSEHLYNQDITIYTQFWITIKHFILPFIISVVLGVFLGIAFSINKRINIVSNYFIDFLRVLPSIVFISLLKYSINISNFTKEIFNTNEGLDYVYFVVVIASIWPIIIATKEGVQKVNNTSSLVIRQLDIPWRKKLFLFTIPEAFPNIFNGLKISLGIALLISITCEYITKEINGLGAVLSFYEDQGSGSYLHTIVIIIIMGFIGLILNFILEIIEDNILWLKNQYKTDE